MTFLQIKRNLGWVARQLFLQFEKSFKHFIKIKRNRRVSTHSTSIPKAIQSPRVSSKKKQSKTVIQPITGKLQFDKKAIYENSK